MNVFLNGSHLTSPERSQFTNTNTTLSSSPDTVTNFTSQTTFKPRKNSDDQTEKRSAYTISNILEKKQNSPVATSSSGSDDDTGSPRCGSTEEEHGILVIMFYLRRGHYKQLITKEPAIQAYLSFLVGQQLNSAAAVAAANPLRILAHDQGFKPKKSYLVVEESKELLNYPGKPE
ncbi:unnamed protein product [Angiostrongylus costaricensis]|uniref:Uncharacterized protein n=1 Tax=Angiostrongylus costaricensis TaxID=334426 RepID=A0A0R3PF53_ANGCS|nr:unnamed protein product [Angiostrongylus costaricensis]